MISLAVAVAIAHGRLFPDEPKNPRTLAVIALALSSLMPIFRLQPQTGELVELTDPELRTGTFNRSTNELFSVSKRCFESALEMMRVGSMDEARVSLTLRQSPRAVSAQR